MEEAIEWAKRCPLPENGLIEVRQIFEAPDFPPELQPQGKSSRNAVTSGNLSR
jgi:hypothetical protein